MIAAVQKVDILTKELALRKEANPLYSHRAFSRDLEVSHTLLSLVINGKRDLSPELSKKLLKRGKYIDQYDRSILKIGLETYEKKKFKAISLDFFGLISHWSYYALLSLLETANFKWDADFIAKRLKLSKEKSRELMERAQSLDLITQNDQGKWIQNNDPIAMENPTPNEFTKNYNRELLKKAVESMDFDDPALRDLSSITFAMDPAHLPYAVERIRQFRRTLCQELEEMGDPKEAYTIAVQIFPLSKNEV